MCTDSFPLQENWLKEVQDMQAHCEAGLKYFSMNHALPIAEEFRSAGFVGYFAANSISNSMYYFLDLHILSPKNIVHIQIIL